MGQLLKDCDDHLDLAVIHFVGEKGRGVIATRDYNKGEFVVEYSGTLVKVGRAAKEREDVFALNTNTGGYMYYFKHDGTQYWCGFKRIFSLTHVSFDTIFCNH
jgi:hypothetical protein